MTTRNLDKLLAPRSVALIGASARQGAVGGVLAQNLTRGGFDGPVFPVNPHLGSVGGVLAYPDIASLPQTPDLAVIATPADTVPAIIGELAARGTRAAIVIGAGFGARDPRGPELAQALLDTAQPTVMRIVGPNCLGVAVPGIGLNATFAHITSAPGDIACVTQSGAVATALLDWAAARGIGFSHLVSLGDMRDVDFGDMIDHLAVDPGVRAILLYVEQITSAPKFMSAARAAARMKPIVVLKSGRFPESAAAAASHTGALAGADRVYDAAFRRAGCLRVDRFDELLAVTEALARAHPAGVRDGARIGHERVAIMTNGGGLGVLATDALIARGGRLATLAPITRAALAEVLPKTWSDGNPIDIIGDADGERYAAALELLLGDETIDAVVVLNCPTAIASAQDAARAVARVATFHHEARRTGDEVPVPIFAGWVGGATAAAARAELVAAGVATFETPEQAIEGLVRRSHYVRARADLLRVPPALAAIDGAVVPPDRAAAHAVIEPMVAAGGGWLDEIDAKALLAAYGVPVARGERVATVADVADAARRLLANGANRCAVKLISPDVLHKSDFGGVALDLLTPEAATAAAAAIVERVKSAKPEARIAGFAVQEMVRRPGAQELILGATVDPTFGPVLLFGQGGVAVEAIADTAIALPPLDVGMARDLIDRTRVASQLRGYRRRPPAHLDAIAAALVRVSGLVAEQAAVVEIDVNPLLVDEHGVVALDARIRVAREPRVRMALAPYPVELERTITLDDGTILAVRPVRPDDAPRYVENFRMMDQDDIRSRFFTILRELPPTMLARLTQIDYERELALIAEQPRGGDDPNGIYGIVRLTSLPDGARAEFGIIVRSDWKGRGLGTALMRMIIAYARERSIALIEGSVLRENQVMLDLAEDLGFMVLRDSDDPFIVKIVLPLGDSAD
jgi:acetyltransferase